MVTLHTFETDTEALDRIYGASKSRVLRDLQSMIDDLPIIVSKPIGEWLDESQQSQQEIIKYVNT